MVLYHPLDIIMNDEYTPVPEVPVRFGWKTYDKMKQDMCR